MPAAALQAVLATLALEWVGSAVTRVQQTSWESSPEDEDSS